jgi:hypothetical protein
MRQSGPPPPPAPWTPSCVEWSTGGPGIGVVTDIHGQTFGDGTGDTITVIPAAVTLSTGDRYPVADLVLLRRAES